MDSLSNGFERDGPAQPFANQLEGLSDACIRRGRRGWRCADQLSNGGMRELNQGRTRRARFVGGGQRFNFGRYRVAERGDSLGAMEKLQCAAIARFGLNEDLGHHLSARFEGMWLLGSHDCGGVVCPGLTRYLEACASAIERQSNLH